MAWFKFLKAEAKTEGRPSASANAAMQEPPQNDVFKAYIPNFLYKPPFGYPMNKNVPQLRNLAKNPYIFSVIKTLKNEASTAKYEIRVKKEYAEDKFNGNLNEDIKQVSNFFNNPNGNDENFGDILSCWIQDLCEVDAAVGVKVYNKRGKFSQLFARDGGTFLKNCDIYGYMGNRADYVDPIESVFDLRGLNNDPTPSPENIKYYRTIYTEKAAYFQYGWTGLGLPVPFGKKEIVYIMSTPRSDSIYGRSPIEILYDTILTLIYGQTYNLDFYLNGNTPDGLINLVGADKDIAEAFQERMKGKFQLTDGLNNNRRVGHIYPVYGGPKAEFIPFQLGAKDMEIIEQQKWFTKLVWACFGVTPDEMGFTEDSNKAVSQTQQAVHKRKALKPMLKRIEYAINCQLMPELDPTGKLEFCFEDYDIDEELKKYQLYQAQVTMGVKTAEMVAKEEGINIEELKKHKEEERQARIDEIKQTQPNNNFPGIKAEGHWVTHNGKHIFIGEHDAGKQDNPASNPLHPDKMTKEQRERYGRCYDEACKWADKTGGDVYSSGSHAIGVRNDKVFDHVLGYNEDITTADYAKKVPYQFKLVDRKNGHEPEVKAHYLKEGVLMTYPEIIDEHKKLVGALESKDSDKIKEVLDDQKKELAVYEKQAEVKSDALTSYFEEVERKLIERLRTDGRSSA